MKAAAPTQTSMCVRRPASCSRSSRSMPIAPARTAATASRRRDSQSAISGASLGATLGLCGLSLRVAEPLDAAGGEVEQLVEQLAGEGVALGRRLDLYQPPVARHHDVHV